MLFIVLRILLAERRKVSGVIDETMRTLRADRDKMLATALEAKGVQMMDAQPRTLAAVPPPEPILRKVAGKLKALEAEHMRMAQDRDERVAAEMEEARRLALEKLEANH